MWSHQWRPISVLGPTLLNIYTNDIFELATSHLPLYADDSKLFGAVNHEPLQADLDHIQNWITTRHLNFHTDKSCVIHFGKSKPGFKYTTDNPPPNNIQELPSVNQQKGSWNCC